MVEGLNTFKELLEMAISLFIIMDPLGVVPLFVSLTRGMSKKERDAIALKTSLTVMITLITVELVGRKILAFLGVNLPSFQVAGGIILTILALEMLHAFDSPMKRKQEEHEEASLKAQKDEPIWLIPLAIPMLTGPATMSTAMLFFAKAGTLTQKLTLVSISFLLGLIVYVVLRWATAIANKLGKAGINVMTRLMGLVLLTIAVDMIVKGVRELWIH